MKTNGFKIIAIKPLNGCPLEYVKILNHNTIYYLYNNYHINDDDSITYIEKIPCDFYKVNDIDISISAVVGKNGSGKSTIIELLFRAINNFTIKQDQLNTGLKHINKLKLDIYFHTEKCYKLRIDYKETNLYEYDNKGNIIPEPLNNFKLHDFFYTIAVNYSHYSYNVRDFKKEVNWLDGMFHKNDGYQTPLVINPMRIHGNIDINNENHLAKSRLISNLLRPHDENKNNLFRNITNNLTATALKLKLNKSKSTSVIYEIFYNNEKTARKITTNDLNIKKEEILYSLNKIYYFNFNQSSFNKFRIVYDYIIYKLASIATKYVEYTEYFSKEGMYFHQKSLKTFLKKIINDHSHITFKLKQTLNFLKHKHINLNDKEVSLDVLSKRIESILKSHKRPTEISEFTPPPIFEVDIILSPSKGVKRKIEFSKLSSGEKQMTYSISSVLYHLINLNSISTSNKKIRYRYINIVLEEIELYFHPEMQRTYIKNILDSISRISFKRIKAINFCFVTHSPFILSDIPNSNILFLDEDGTPLTDTKGINTFGGNIHELLAHSFFLGNGLIGEFAKNKIQLIIDDLATNKKEEATNTENNNILKQIQIIGEPFLKEKLLEMYYMKYGKQKRIMELKNELYRLERND